jgi:pimeloyl-ACP methyl ester carboxylesterase
VTATMLQAAGATVAYEVVGAGPPVVLVHGLTESRRIWDPLVEPLAADHTVVLLDLPGHGESGPSEAYDGAALANAVGSVVAATGIDPPLLVGHSLGGWVVTVAARSLPCRGVLNVDQRLDLTASRAAIAPLEPDLRGDEATFERVLNEDFDEYLGALGGHERARIEHLRRPRQDVVLAIWAPFFELSEDELEGWVRERVGGVTAPYLSVLGRDPGEGYADWLEELIPGAVVELWPDMGHYPHLVEPERFLARLRSFEEVL